MSKVKISVVKQFSPEDVIGKEFIRADGNPIEKCGMKEGLEFTVGESGDMPEGFCHHAWYGLYKNLSILQCGGGFPNWTGEDMIYTACPDGIRPVCFKLERISE
ncbi:MAG: TIGR04076 family protein [Candidatus Lokiarchaeota archaeon]|nr:TIGR04076 family protein [Candidatus Lokiarchaeota archaeon]